MVKNGVSKTYPKIISSLKRLREILDWSVQRVFEETQKAFPESYPSLSSVKNIFKDGSENMSFNYHLTLEPVERTMTDFAQKNGFSEEDSEVYFAQRINLQAVVEEKTALLNKLSDENNALKKENEKLKAENETLLKENAQLRTAKDYVKEQCEKLMKLLENITGNK